MIDTEKVHLKLVPALKLNIEEGIFASMGQHVVMAKFKNRKIVETRLHQRDAHASGPGSLCDFLIAYLGLKNDAALARRLSFSPPRISKIRHLSCPVSGELLIRMHEVFNLSIHRLRALMGAIEII